MPEFQTFFTGERLADFWYFVKWFLFLVAPALMIWVASEAVMKIVIIIRKSVGKANDDDDDDYDVYRY